jgi:excinuclease ABC subunit A
MPENKSQNIIVKGARMHNLKNIDIEIPRNKLVVVTGVSGSGKSSLAFDTLYAEGQRRYIESFSSYAQQFLGIMDKPDVDKIEGLPPAISIEGQSVIRNPRSTVGTMTEIYDLLRLLFSRIGKPHCPKCQKLVSRQSISKIAGQILRFPSDTEVLILAPQKGKSYEILKNLQEKGFVRARINGKIYKIEEVIKSQLNGKLNSIEALVDKFVVDKKDLDRGRVIDSVETALKLGNGIIIVNDSKFSDKFICQRCEIILPEIEPRLFSFNSPQGACPKCTGLGIKLEVDPALVIPNPKLSLAEGVIRPWAMTPYRMGKQNPQWQALEKLAQKYNFSLDAAVKDLPKNVLDIILYGEGDYEGVIPNLERRYKETDSEHARTEIENYMIVKTCPTCQGKRLNAEALAITVAEKNIDEIVNMNIENCKKFFEKILAGRKLIKEEDRIAEPIVKEIIKNLNFLTDVSLGYLTLFRDAPSLSAGEAQRVKLANQIGSKLTGVLYVLDEPSIGLHPRDQERLIKSLKNLRDIGNTVLVVEHDEQTITAADWIIDIGPGAGEHGGRVIFEGTPKGLLKSKTPTGEYLSGQKKIGFRAQQFKTKNYLSIKGATEHNLKNIDVKIPLGIFTCITGVSGSGKSTLMNDILANALARKFYRTRIEPGACKEIRGLENLNKVVIVDQSPIGRTPRSNPATYTGIFTPIRDLFVETKPAKSRGYGAGHFSFNVKGGRCEECQGAGLKKIEMYFLPDNYVKCPECQGRRYNKEILEIKYRGVDISEVLEMSIEEALTFFKGIPALRDKLSILNDVGLGYMKLGQPAPSLSGGEAQRVKLATELSRKSTGKTIYILDEPTTGLHPADIKNLLNVLKKLVDKGNTILVVEHNLDIIKNADWIIDLGPEGGDKGGYIVAEGTPDQIMKAKSSYTGQWLKKYKI